MLSRIPINHSLIPNATLRRTRWASGGSEAPPPDPPPGISQKSRGTFILKLIGELGVVS